jgi:CubicO group peptidase (beta-lactamase class C family)
VRTHILEPLGLSGREMGFVVPDPARHAQGYLARYSLMNLVKGLVIDRAYIGEYTGRWLRLQDHYLDGAAYGGLVGTARAFACFLRDQLQLRSVLLDADSKRLLETPRFADTGRAIPMTLGWHVGRAAATDYLFKEGGGGGFHGEMRLYPARQIASVVLANSTTFDSTRFLDHVDAGHG